MSTPHDLTQPVRRRTALATLASLFATVSCGGGGSSSAPLASPPPPPPAAPARLTFDGSVMRDASGNAVMLRGINEGTWGAMQSGDAAMIAAQGGNVVRVLIRWWGLYGGSNVESRDDGDPGHFLPDHLTEFLQNVQWCLDAGLWVVPAIDSNCGQNGLQNEATIGYCDPTDSYPGGHNFWTDLTQRQRFTQAWIYLAGLLKGYDRIAFYELLPEPLQGRDSSYGVEVSSFYQELMAAIDDATADTRTPYLVGARDAYDIQLCDEAYISDPRWADRVVYTGDLFIHTNGTQSENLADLQTRLGALADMKAKRDVPVFIQQFGVRTGDDPTEFYLAAGLSQMNAAGIGYTGWQWRQNTTDPDEYAIVVADPVTGADVVKTAVLAVYSSYWKA